MSKHLTLYRCDNPACTLGSRGAPGTFTGGISAAAVHVLTGRPVESLVDGTDFGDGICPNCAAAGAADGVHKQIAAGVDPHADAHAAVAARVADPGDPLDAAGAQSALVELVGGDR